MARTDAVELLSDPELGLIRERREPQIDLARAIRRWLRDDKTGFAEAGTGTGKSFAYLAPAFERCANDPKYRIVICTAMKGLQQQLYFKDLPLLQKWFPTVKYARILGKKNYGCARLVDTYCESMQEQRIYDEFFSTVPEWVWDDAPDELRLPQTTWKYGRAYCNKTRCDHYDKCSEFGTLHAQDMRESAQIILTNHAMYGAAIRVWRQHGTALLPRHDALIVDEAHKFPEALRGALSLDITSRWVSQRAKRVQDYWRSLGSSLQYAMLGKELDAIPRTLLNEGELDSRLGEMFHEVRQSGELGPAAMAFAECAQRTARLYESALGMTGESWRALRNGNASSSWGTDFVACTAAVTLALYCEEISRELDEFSRGLRQARAQPSRHAITVEASEHGNVLRAVPLQVSAALDEYQRQQRNKDDPRDAPVDVEHAFPSVYLSATLAVKGNFAPFARDVCTNPSDAGTLLVPTPFDMATQVRAYYARMLPDPTGATRGAWVKEAVQEALQLLLANEGHAFILFTAKTDLRDFHEALLKAEYPYPLLVQQDDNKGRLRQQFQSTPNATLLGLKSMWEGIDIPGMQLSLVIVPKLPFPPQNDAVYAARCVQAGDRAFAHITMPAMLTDLRQGVGRLIRTQKDKGVVAILDSRISYKPYAKDIQTALDIPKYTHDIKTILKVFPALRAYHRQGDALAGE